MSKPPFRRRIRIPGCDNAVPGVWFLTLNVDRNQEVLGRVVDERVERTELGTIVRDCWLQVPQHFPHVRPDDFIVMPNHLHSVLYLARAPTGHVVRAERFGAPVPGSLATIVRSFKAATTLQIRRLLGQPVIVWQARFYERRLRDLQSVAQVRRYTARNPARWTQRRGRAGQVADVPAPLRLAHADAARSKP